MNSAAAGLCIAVALGFVASATVKAAEPSSVPKRFHAHIGGFLGGDYVVEMREGVLTYSARAQGRGHSPTLEKVAPTPSQWREFRQALDALKVWQWKSEYPTHGILDGTQWSLDIAYDDQSLATQGSNNFPDDDGQSNGTPVPTETFQRYLAAVKKLLGGRAFD